MLHRTKTLEGAAVHARDGSLGKVKDFYFDDRAWTVRYLVVATGTLFTRHYVILSPTSVTRLLPQENAVELDLSKEQVKNSPTTDDDKPVSRQQELALHEYYGWQPYWGTGGLAAAAVLTDGAIGSATVPSAADQRGESLASAETNPGDPHLRSANEVSGYGIEAMDGDLGHLDEFLVDGQKWTLDFAIVDTRNWLPGRKVAVPVSVLKGISWADRRVFSSLNRQEIEASPELESSPYVSMHDEERLRTYYSRLAVVQS